MCTVSLIFNHAALVCVLIQDLHESGVGGRRVYTFFLNN